MDAVASDRADAPMTTGLPQSKPGQASAHPPASRSAARRLWQAATGVIGGIVGLAPHVLHHVGFLAGTALVAGSGGTALFGVGGLAASVPLLLRLHRRFDSWRAPAIALAVFALLFSLSAFVVGPLISGDASGPPGTPPGIEHVDHDLHGK